MEIMDWVAILGALAWSPHLLKTIQNYFKKPVVQLITQKNPEIGFTTLGPILNWQIAFIVEGNGKIALFANSSYINTTTPLVVGAAIEVPQKTP